MTIHTAILNTDSLPFCKGCGHDLIAKNTAKALEKMGYDPLDVIVVTDIGCHGIIDKCLNTHTVHGLHGRSAALGAGIAFGVDNPNKKVIVFIGDGGSTIGLQHIMEAARLNLPMTVVVHNNFLYGMTGGQTSGLTPQGFNTTTSYEGNPYAGYDICALSHTAGATLTSRIIGIGDYSDKLAVAFGTKGFSLIEVMEICPSYGVKLNPKRKLKEIVEEAGREIGEWINKRNAFENQQGRKTNNLFAKVPDIKKVFNSYLKHPMSIILSGSAGEGVQLAATLLSEASIRSGLSVTQKGSYPVTVGVGFSTAELNLSPEEILFHGIDVPDVVVITSADGLAHNKARIKNMKSGKLFIDSSLTVPETGAEIIAHDFRSIGARDASIYGVFYFALKSGIISTESLFKTIEEKGLTDKLPMEKIKVKLAEA
ncbi:MAG: 2-oxoacid:acceptor oxidoreductase family protein [Bacteroidetes bacterium]|nr:2-oxoacid:acceptor oxidoreductase family protein [Bacteroidota bacterium]